MHDILVYAGLCMWNSLLLESQTLNKTSNKILRLKSWQCM